MGESQYLTIVVLALEMKRASWQVSAHSIYNSLAAKPA
jgi:hypothetical protein